MRRYRQENLHLRELAKRVLDQQVIDGIDKMVAELEAQKVALHLEQKQ